MRIGWHQSSIEIDAGVTDQKVFVVLENKYAPTTYGVWSFQVNIMYPAAMNKDTAGVTLYPNSLSSNFSISKNLS